LVLVVLIKKKVYFLSCGNLYKAVPLS